MIEIHDRITFGFYPYRTARYVTAFSHSQLSWYLPHTQAVTGNKTISGMLCKEKYCATFKMPNINRQMEEKREEEEKRRRERRRRRREERRKKRGRRRRRGGGKGEGEGEKKDVRRGKRREYSMTKDACARIIDIE